MIDFEGYYSIAVERVEYISMSSKENGDYPYTLSVHLESERALSVSYRNKDACAAARNKLCQQIEAERRRSSDEIIARLSIIRDGVERVDKRQFRIWKQLKTLLNVEPEEKI